MRDVAIVQFQSDATAAIASVSLGFIPAVVIALLDNRATNPNVRIWVNQSVASDWQAGADDSLLVTGSTGVITVDTASISAYAGGDTVAAADVTAKRYFKRNGTVHAAGDLTKPGFTVPAGDQSNSGYNTFICFRADVL